MVHLLHRLYGVDAPVTLYTVSQKSSTPNSWRFLNGFSKFFHCWKAQ